MAAQEEYTCTLDPDTLAKAKEELNEDPDTRLMEIKYFKERLLQVKGLTPRTDPQFLLRFLRARKFDQEKAFELIHNFYKMKKDDPDIFDGLKPSNLLHAYKWKFAYPHSKRDREGRTIYVVHPGRIDTTHYSYSDVVKAEFLNLSKMIEAEENQVRGFTILCDYTDFSMGHFMHMNLAFAKRMTRIWMQAFPARLKCVLLINEPHFIDLIKGLFNPLLTSKLLSRMHYLGKDLHKLQEFIDPSCLPPEYGGTLQEEAEAENWLETLLSCDKEMEEEGKFGFVDYTIGHETNKHQQDAITHMAGTFKKLDV